MVIGFNPLAMILIRPDASAIFMIPSQSAMIPINPMEISTATFDILMAASVTASILPVKIPATTLMAIIPNQM